MLLVEATTLEPLPAGQQATELEQPRPGGPQVTVELQQEQLEVISPPQTTLAGQLAAIHIGRSVAEQAAARVGGRVVALPTAPGWVVPHLVPGPRYRRIDEQFGLTAAEQLTNGFHIHVGVASRGEAVTVLDRIRIWLPALLALSVSSPFWHGVDTGYASYRYQVLSRWPTAGPTEVFGSAAGYDRHRTRLLDTGVPVDVGMLYYDARLSEHHPTVEIRIADVCADPADAAVIAALARALVETAARQGRRQAPDVPAAQLRAWSWLASRSGVEGRLIDLSTGTPAPAGDVMAGLLEYLRPVLSDYGEEHSVETVVVGVLRRGTGSRHQRQAYATGQQIRDVVAAALDATHRSCTLPSSAGQPTTTVAEPAVDQPVDGASDRTPPTG